MKARTAQDVIPDTKAEQVSYLRAGISLRSWLLTTDHKRIAILYILSITFFSSWAARRRR
ncbi:hypothetical protein [Pedomonas mirosovicensis]|uniref:hypothetical protein n=1 Tax=Pedomonas mirosovicensis TaxID=2908641 RepID=UPI002167416F|nr:hypothetical protein [Pedomonas mirosovicensis]MCH8686706.1 hypothetical protein [Pedomonas mirosovicensis]